MAQFQEVRDAKIFSADFPRHGEDDLNMAKTYRTSLSSKNETQDEIVTRLVAIQDGTKNRIEAFQFIRNLDGSTEIVFEGEISKDIRNRILELNPELLSKKNPDPIINEATKGIRRTLDLIRIAESATGKKNRKRK